MSRATHTLPVTGLAVFLLLSGDIPLANAGFHLWHVKEVFSNADGSVQFVEMFDSFGGENFVGSFRLRANSDGVIKDFFFPANLTGDTAGHHLLIATTGFGSLPGAVTPDFTFDQSTTPFTGLFINPNATNITVSFNGSNDSMVFTGTSLPKNGIDSLTDAGATGFPPGTPSISSGVNSPTNFSNSSGSVNLSPSPDYNGNHVVDAADYVSWRQNPAGHGGNPGGYNNWRSNFGNPAGLGTGGGIPEPASFVYLLAGLIWLAVRQSRRRASSS